MIMKHNPGADIDGKECAIGFAQPCFGRVRHCARPEDRGQAKAGEKSLHFNSPKKSDGT